MGHHLQKLGKFWVSNHYLANVRNGLEDAIVRYYDYLRNWLLLIIFCWFPQFWCKFYSIKLSKFGVADHYRANVQMEWPYVCYGYISWPPSELVPFLLYFATFPNFGALLFSQSKQIWNCRHLPWWCTGAGAMGVSFGGVMYPDHLKNWMCFDYILLFFLILVCFRSVTLGKFRDADNYLGNVQRGCPGFYNVYVSWSPSDQVAFLSGFIEFLNFGAILFLQT